METTNKKYTECIAIYNSKRHINGESAVTCGAFTNVVDITKYSDEERIRFRSIVDTMLRLMSEDSRKMKMMCVSSEECTTKRYKVSEWVE